jgi:two-component system, OmpR family, response regulator MprA
MRVLVVDDEPAVRISLSRALELRGYDIATAEEGEVALELIRRGEYDAVVLDVAMPGMDGFELCRRLRSGGDETPVLMLTARDAVRDRVTGLDAGADDYVVKPFALDELAARLKAITRRQLGTGADGLLQFDDLRLDPAAHLAWRGERRLDLTRTEFMLLELFMRNPRQVLSRSVIFERVWGYDFGSASNSLGVYIGYLRRKLEAGNEVRVLHTIRGVGYVLREA